MKKAIVVTGATGNVGHELALKLLAQGQRVIALGRRREALADLVEKGAEASIASLEDRDAVKEALRDAVGVFAMVPPNRSHPDQDGFAHKIAENVVAGIRESGVQTAVVLSSSGIDLGLEANHRVFEGVFDEVQGLNVAHLRPALFMESHLRNIGLIKTTGENRGYFTPTFEISMVATRDIADAAATHLGTPFTGRKIHYLLGARDYTMPEATRILGESVGLPNLQYRHFTEAESRQRMESLGFSQDYADKYIETRNVYNKHARMSFQERSSENTTKTTLEEFAKTVFAPAFAAHTS